VIAAERRKRPVPERMTTLRRSKTWNRSTVDFVLAEIAATPSGTPFLSGANTIIRQRELAPVLLFLRLFEPDSVT